MINKWKGQAKKLGLGDTKSMAEWNKVLEKENEISNQVHSRSYEIDYRDQNQYLTKRYLDMKAKSDKKDDEEGAQRMKDI